MMLETRLLRERLNWVVEKMAQRGVEIDFQLFKVLDEKRRALLSRAENLRYKRNVVSDEIAEMKKAKKDAGLLIAEMREVSREIKELENELGTVESELSAFMMTVPNIQDDSVPPGQDETHNQVCRVWGEKPSFDFEPLPHWISREAPRLPGPALPFTAMKGPSSNGLSSTSCWICTLLVMDIAKYFPPSL
jgi:seryl-tRNA synthetase